MEWIDTIYPHDSNLMKYYGWPFVIFLLSSKFYGMSWYNISTWLNYFNEILWLTICHIDILYHFIWDKFENRKNELSYIFTCNKLVNIMIEGLPHGKFEHFCNHLTSLHPKTYKLYSISMKSHTSSKRVLWEFSCTNHGTCWCSLAITRLPDPLYVVVSMNHDPHKHNIFLASTSQHLNKVPLLQNSPN
jgi:hypothetical protein